MAKYRTSKEYREKFPQHTVNERIYEWDGITLNEHGYAPAENVETGHGYWFEKWQLEPVELTRVETKTETVDKVTGVTLHLTPGEAKELRRLINQLGSGSLYPLFAELDKLDLE